MSEKENRLLPEGQILRLMLPMKYPGGAHDRVTPEPVFVRIYAKNTTNHLPVKGEAYINDRFNIILKLCTQDVCISGQGQ